MAPALDKDGTMTDWSPLRRLLAGVDVRLTISWSELDRLVGGLPRSAYEHSAFWKGERSGWPGFTTADVRVGDAVTFVRRAPGHQPPPPSRSAPEARPKGEIREPADVVLVGCVKKKLDRPAQARDLYTSALFRKERAYAEATKAPWFVLSAEHGLVEPTRVIEPYELHLSSTSRAYRIDWGRRVVEALTSNVGDLRSKVIEIHAGKAYVEAIHDGLTAARATVVVPLAGLTMGERLAWYPPVGSVAPPVPAAVRPEEVDDLVEHLRDGASALTPDELLAAGPRGLDAPGLYSWWVDAEGADDLSQGLDERIDPGLIYAGLAGATRARSGRRSTNTLWGRLRGMHLGSRHEFSTFRRSLGSILAETRGASTIDEGHLTAWMHDHLRVIAVPVQDADALDRLESEVLAELDPPLNLAKMPKNAVRVRLTQLRRLHSKKRVADRGSDQPAPPADEAEQLEPDGVMAEVDRARQDEELTGLLDALVERDKEILDRLAE